MDAAVVAVCSGHRLTCSEQRTAVTEVRVTGSGELLGGAHW